MKIQWLGTAGFKIETQATAFLIDPYLSRNIDADPRQDFLPKDLAPASHIFISHGHFDHIMDIPAIARQTCANVFCSPTVAHTLSDMGMEDAQIEAVDHDQYDFEFNGVKAKAFYSRHVRFDAKLLITTLARIGRRVKEILPLFLNFPCGQVLGWQFDIEDKRIVFFGSGGSTKKELEALAEDPMDILLVPLQGHSHICSKALEYVEILKPKLVIPHHQDNFFPPVSQTIDINPFVEQVPLVSSNTMVKVVELNEIIEV